MGAFGGRLVLKSAVSLCPTAELEFVQIVVIVVVMMVMVVVITCLLNHYKLSARSFISRHSQARRRDDGLSSVSDCCWGCSLGV